MWLGFPAQALARVGITGLPRDAMLPLALRGSLHKPSVDWLECARGPLFNHARRALPNPTKLTDVG
jgi:hypothetical protein